MSRSASSGRVSSRSSGKSYDVSCSQNNILLLNFEKSTLLVTFISN